MSDSDLRQALLGTWRLISLQGTVDGTVSRLSGWRLQRYALEPLRQPALSEAEDGSFMERLGRQASGRPWGNSLAGHRGGIHVDALNVEVS